jgi:superfamily II DNA helicase RecQ
MEEQNQKLQVAKIRSVAIHANHMPTGLEDQLIAGEYQAVFMSPETIFEHPRFKSLWDIAEWRARVQAAVIDEAHCIIPWGPDLQEGVR